MLQQVWITIRSNLRLSIYEYDHERRKSVFILSFHFRRFILAFAVSPPSHRKCHSRCSSPSQHFHPLFCCSASSSLPTNIFDVCDGLSSVVLDERHTDSLLRPSRVPSCFSASDSCYQASRSSHLPQIASCYPQLVSSPASVTDSFAASLASLRRTLTDIFVWLPPKAQVAGGSGCLASASSLELGSAT